MTDLAELLARNEERLARLARIEGLPGGLQLRRRVDAVVRRLARMVGGAAAVAIVAFLWGLFVGPIGFSGVALTVLAMVAVFFLLAFYPRGAGLVVPPVPELSALPLSALPVRLGRWLGTLGGTVPGRAARAIDRVRRRILQLGPELEKLPEGSPLSVEADRLLADHLPRLLDSYLAVPDRLRSGTEAVSRLEEGLEIIDGALVRLGEALAKDPLGRLEVEGRFLEQRYPEKGA